MLVTYRSAVCRIWVHPAARTQTPQGRRARRGKGGQGRSVAPHQGIHGGHTETQFSHNIRQEMGYHFSFLKFALHTETTAHLVADLWLSSHGLEQETEDHPVVMEMQMFRFPFSPRYTVKFRLLMKTVSCDLDESSDTATKRTDEI